MQDRQPAELAARQTGARAGGRAASGRARESMTAAIDSRSGAANGAIRAHSSALPRTRCPTAEHSAALRSSALALSERRINSASD